MSFSDIFKSSFLENVTSVSLLDMALVLVLSFALGLFIFFVYKKTYAGVMYSSSFGVTLVALTMISTLVILAVTSNVVLSLGMVGALSIVRFRTAIKEPLDIAFLFWSIAVGIVIGAGMIPLAVTGSVIIGVILMIFANRRQTGTPYILVMNCDNDAAEKAAVDAARSSVSKYLTKAKTVNTSGIELTAQVRLKDDSTSFINTISGIDGVSNATLVSYSGEFVS